MAGIYVHIPFCRKRCNYCDFYFTTDRKLIEPFLAALKQELESKAPLLANESIDTIYFGGGTPSLLTFSQIRQTLDEITRLYDIESDVEIAVEANPEDCSDEFWRTIHELEINRLSLGLQSFHDKKLNHLQRKHKAGKSFEVAEKAVTEVKNVSFDLIFGTEGETLELWQKDIEHALSFSPQHISPYSLTLEKGTPFFRMVERGKKHPPNNNLQEAMFLDAIATFKKNGYEHYEVSNFARPGFRSKHNMNCWKRHPYLGFGPGAHSFYHVAEKQFREANLKNIKHYIASPSKALDFKEELSDKEILNEQILLGLRQDCGLNMDVLKKRCKFAGSEPIERQSKLEELHSLNLITFTHKSICLTEKGFTLADSVAEELFV